LQAFIPNRFDLLFSSHQLWHICIVAAVRIPCMRAQMDGMLPAPGAVLMLLWLWLA
jgi:hypothetical protein